MNPYYFIAHRIHNADKDSFSFLVSRIARYSIAIGLAVMIISFSILEGFRKKIQDKIFSFGAHIQITKHDVNNSYEESPLPIGPEVYKTYKAIKGVEHIQPYSLKPALLKTQDEVNGVVLKGIDKDFYLEKFKQNIIAGSFIKFEDTTYSREILISKKISEKLRISLGDTVVMYFVQNPPRFRKLVIKGVYETGLEEFDDLMVLGDIRLNRRLNQWGDSFAGGYEIFIENFKKLDKVCEEVYERMDYELELQKVTQQYIQIFDWLELVNQNVIIFLVLILFVAAFNMVSTLLIMIMERTNMIGVLKAMGATDWQIRKIFIYNGFSIVLKGMLVGNIIGLGFCFIQYYFKIIPLDPENYYMDRVPIEWSFFYIAAINAVTLLLILMILFIPIMIISKINPIKSIKFD